MNQPQSVNPIAAFFGLQGLVEPNRISPKLARELFRFEGDMSLSADRGWNQPISDYRLPAPDSPRLHAAMSDVRISLGKRLSSLAGLAAKYEYRAIDGLLKRSSQH